MREVGGGGGGQRKEEREREKERESNQPAGTSPPPSHAAAMFGWHWHQRIKARVSVFANTLKPGTTTDAIEKTTSAGGSSLMSADKPAMDKLDG